MGKPVGEEVITAGGGGVVGITITGLSGSGFQEVAGVWISRGRTPGVAQFEGTVSIFGAGISIFVNGGAAVGVGNG